MSHSRFSTPCMWCKHSYYDADGHPIGVFHTDNPPTCDAFPDGMPYSMLADPHPTYDHRYPHPEDNGLQFEVADLDELERRYAFENYIRQDAQEYIIPDMIANFQDMDDLRRTHGVIKPPIGEEETYADRIRKERQQKTEGDNEQTE